MFRIKLTVTNLNTDSKPDIDELFYQTENEMYDGLIRLLNESYNIYNKNTKMMWEDKWISVEEFYGHEYDVNLDLDMIKITSLENILDEIDDNDRYITNNIYYHLDNTETETICIIERC